MFCYVFTVGFIDRCNSIVIMYNCQHSVLVDKQFMIQSSRTMLSVFNKTSNYGARAIFIHSILVIDRTVAQQQPIPMTCATIINTRPTHKHLQNIEAPRTRYLYKTVLLLLLRAYTASFFPIYDRHCQEIDYLSITYPFGPEILQKVGKQPQERQFYDRSSAFAI